MKTIVKNQNSVTINTNNVSSKKVRDERYAALRNAELTRVVIVEQQRRIKTSQLLMGDGEVSDFRRAYAHRKINELLSSAIQSVLAENEKQREYFLMNAQGWAACKDSNDLGFVHKTANNIRILAGFISDVQEHFVENDLTTARESVEKAKQYGRYLVSFWITISQDLDKKFYPVFEASANDCLAQAEKIANHLLVDKAVPAEFKYIEANIRNVKYAFREAQEFLPEYPNTSTVAEKIVKKYVELLKGDCDVYNLARISAEIASLFCFISSDAVKNISKEINDIKATKPSITFEIGIKKVNYIASGSSLRTAQREYLQQAMEKALAVAKARTSNKNAEPMVVLELNELTAFLYDRR